MLISTFHAVVGVPHQRTREDEIYPKNIWSIIRATRRALVGEEHQQGRKMYTFFTFSGETPHQKR